jgi:hypothetical protein
MNVAINSNARFAETTFGIITESLIKSGFSPENIFFFEGGHDCYERVESNVNRYKCDNDSIDLTGLIAIIELNLTSDYWFYIHDTTSVGPKFYEAVHNFEPGTIAKPLNSGPSMNMGLYSNQLLHDKKDIILSKKNTDLSKESVLNFKSHNVYLEDSLFNEYKGDSYCNGFQYKPPFDVYGNGVMRIQEYYECVDLYKFKANWYVKDVYEVNL